MKRNFDLVTKLHELSSIHDDLTDKLLDQLLNSIEIVSEYFPEYSEVETLDEALASIFEKHFSKDALDETLTSIFEKHFSKDEKDEVDEEEKQEEVQKFNVGDFVRIEPLEHEYLIDPVSAVKAGCVVGSCVEDTHKNTIPVIINGNVYLFPLERLTKCIVTRVDRKPHHEGINIYAVDLGKDITPNIWYLSSDGVRYAYDWVFITTD